MDKNTLSGQLGSICRIIDRLLDRDVFPWLGKGAQPSERERFRAATIVADRLCGALSDPIIRNAQEQRQLKLIEEFLVGRGYRRLAKSSAKLTEIEAGAFGFRINVPVGEQRTVNIPIDVVVQPKRRKKSRLPILIEAKSAGDFTNTNKRRKEEATKIHQLRATYGSEIRLILFLCGYFDTGYLGYEAAEGLDWVWEHRIEDLLKLGL